MFSMLLWMSGELSRLESSRTRKVAKTTLGSEPLSAHREDNSIPPVFVSEFDSVTNESVDLALEIVHRTSPKF
jgi:hypothetical protein